MGFLVTKAFKYSQSNAPVFNANVVVNGAAFEDSEKMAENIMTRLDRMYSQHKQGQLLAPSF